MIADIGGVVTGFCELAGVAAPVLTADGHGTQAAVVCFRGISVTIEQFAEKRPDRVFISADLGVVPEGRTLEAWLVLMDANLYLASAAAPTYSRHPVTHHAFLQWACDLAKVSVTDVYQRVMAMVDTACQWQEEQFLTDPSAAWVWFDRSFAPRQPGASDWREAEARFNTLHAGVTALLGGQAAPSPAPGNVRSFTVNYRGVEVAVLQSAYEGFDSVCSMVRLYGAGIDAPAEMVFDLMEMNFHLANGNGDERVVRRRASGDVLLLCSQFLEAMTPEVLLAQGHLLAGIAQHWQPDPAHAQPSVLIEA